MGYKIYRTPNNGSFLNQTLKYSCVSFDLISKKIGEQISVILLEKITIRVDEGSRNHEVIETVKISFAAIKNLSLHKRFFFEELNIVSL